jgi:hypothetical protein
MENHSKEAIEREERGKGEVVSPDASVLSFVLRGGVDADVFVISLLADRPRDLGALRPHCG